MRILRGKHRGRRGCGGELESRARLSSRCDLVRSSTWPKVTGFALLLAIVFAGCRSPEEQLAEHWQRAEAYRAAERWDAARIELLNVLELTPQDARAHFTLAETLLALAPEESRAPAEALMQLRRAVELAPEEVEFRARLGLLELAARREPAAREHAEFILARDPDNVDGWLIRGQAAALRRDPAAQIEALQRAVELDPERGSARVLLAQAHLRRNDFEAAEQQLRALISRDRTTAAYLHWAAFLVERSRSDEAEKAFAQAIAVASSDTERLEARTRLANFRIAVGELDQAEKVMLEVLEEQPRNAALLAQLARFYALQGRAEKAEAMLGQQLERDPGTIEPYLALSQLYAYTGRRSRAFAILDAALARSPEDEQARMLRASLLLSDTGPQAVERRAEARELVEQVLAQHPTSPAALFAQGKFLLADGAYSRAARQLEQVVAAEPSTNARHLLAAAYAASGDDVRAVEQLRDALQADPSSLELGLDLAELELRLGNPAVTASWTVRALARRPDSARALLLAAGAAVRLGDASKARESLRSVLEEAATGVPPVPVSKAGAGPKAGEVSKTAAARTKAGVREADPVPAEPKSLLGRLLRRDSAAPRVRAAELLLDLGDAERARQLLSDELERRPADFRALRAWIGALGATAPESEVSQRLSEAIGADPASIAGYALRAEFGFSSLEGCKGDPCAALAEAVEDDFATVLRLCDARDSARPCSAAERASAHAGVARVQRVRAESMLALGSYRHAIDLASGVLAIDLELERAAYLEELGRSDAARDSYTRVLSVEPDHALASNRLARSLARAADVSPADLQRALVLARVALKRDPESSEYAATLGHVLLRQELPRAAAAAFQDSIRLARTPHERSEARFHLARAQDAAGDSDAARAELARALDEADSFPSREAALELRARLGR